MKKPSQIAVEAAENYASLLTHPEHHPIPSLASVIQYAIDKATEEFRQENASLAFTFENRQADLAKAEAACAEMRRALSFCEFDDEGCRLDGPSDWLVEAALSSTCGNNHVPIEDVKPLLETMMKTKRSKTSSPNTETN